MGTLQCGGVYAEIFIYIYIRRRLDGGFLGGARSLPLERRKQEISLL